MPQDMKNITVVPSGYLVRKTVHGHLYQCFFGESKYGGMDDALAAAVVYRDSLKLKAKEAGSYQESNINNKTGFVGVAWHCRENRHRSGAAVHSFRAQAPLEGRQPLSKAWSISSHGLWTAYEQAVIWRNTQVFGTVPAYEDMLRAFTEFMDYYCEEMKNKSVAMLLRNEMTACLACMVNDRNIPEEVKDCVPMAVRKEFTRSGGGPMKLAISNDNPIKVESIARQLLMAQEDGTAVS